MTLSWLLSSLSWNKIPSLTPVMDNGEILCSYMPWNRWELAKGCVSNSYYRIAFELKFRNKVCTLPTYYTLVMSSWVETGCEPRAMNWYHCTGVETGCEPRAMNWYHAQEWRLGVSPELWAGNGACTTVCNYCSLSVLLVWSRSGIIKLLLDHYHPTATAGTTYMHLMSSATDVQQVHE